MKRLRLAVVAALFAAAALSGRAFAETGDGLEGTVWKYRPKGIISWFCFWNRDYLVFQSGNFMKAALKDDGYSPALYTATKTGFGIKWSATLGDGKSGQVSWDGLRVSYWMTGTYKRDDRTVQWKAWQIFPKPSKQAPAAPQTPPPSASPSN